MIKLYYFDEEYNFGDQLNLTILEKIFSKKCKKPHYYMANLSMIGSVLQNFLYQNENFNKKLHKFAAPTLNIFGSGFIFAPRFEDEKFIKKTKVYALRGKLTQARLSKILNRDLSDVVLGDPGLLCKYLLPKNNTKKEFKVGIVPHYKNKNDKAVDELYKDIPGSVIIDIQSEPISFLEKINKCETIISSAMHCLIASDAFGIPNCRAKFSNPLPGGDYKFDDYYSVFKSPTSLTINFAEERNHLPYAEIPNMIRDRYVSKSHEIDVICQSLIETFPKMKL